MINGQHISPFSDAKLLIDTYYPCVTTDNSNSSTGKHILSAPSNHVKVKSIYKGFEVGLGQQ